MRHLAMKKMMGRTSCCLMMAKTLISGKDAYSAGPGSHALLVVINVFACISVPVPVDVSGNSTGPLSISDRNSMNKRATRRSERASE